jgi:hypothetical protein
MRDQQGQKFDEIVGSWNRLPELLEQCFEVFLSGLLTVKTALVMERLVIWDVPDREPIVGLGFSHPLPRQPFHRESYPWW